MLSAILSVLLQATEAAARANFAEFGAAFGAAFTAIGAAYGISRIGASAMEAIARQPEASGDIRSNMIVSAALIEGVSFFAVIVCALVLFV
ncbi:ATP synthase F0 subcomplex C subunit [Tangfeifania diversioriginum]|uniref:ATP synthase subunit c n=1 Tax=Tangfeifania diversioriginum TaxID=1168035 RepID=A0A1M6ILC8_9BACT|nr:ATP synthase F0 subunit C [Tangfeifania diversioriginum]SHJ35230.1 ATP synthase F0 subcomplex C subunit [Tangfeifania diversioriginum]